jgi:hypothetical protein
MKLTEKMKEVEKKKEKKMNDKDDWVLSQVAVDAAPADRVARAELNVVNKNEEIYEARSVSSDNTAPFKVDDGENIDTRRGESCKLMRFVLSQQGRDIFDVP